MANGRNHSTGGIVIWRFHDGRRGHFNQIEGLVRSLARRVAVEEVQLLTAGGWLDGIRTINATPAKLPPPTLMVGAGHRTHVPMLWARRRHGGRAIVLMRPSLPRRLFDLCIVPAHDGVSASATTLLTRGVLNDVRPAASKDPHLALVLVGGPSRDHGWDEAAMAEQVAAVIASASNREWLICDSRRTPPSTRVLLAGLARPGVRFVAHDEVDSSWLPRQLSLASLAWVSEDSASMIYEALSAHAAVGALPVPRARLGRVSSGVDALVADGMVTSFGHWREGQPPRPGATPLAEAERCAEWILERWLRHGV